MKLEHVKEPGDVSTAMESNIQKQTVTTKTSSCMGDVELIPVQVLPNGQTGPVVRSRAELVPGHVIENAIQPGPPAMAPIQRMSSAIQRSVLVCYTKFYTLFLLMEPAPTA